MLSILFAASYLFRGSHHNEPTRIVEPSSSEAKSSFSGFRQFFHLLIMSVEDKFKAAVKVIQSLPSDGPYQPANSTKLKFYSLYKQGTEGPCTIPRPAFWDIVGRAKWDAWNKLGSMDKDKAKNEYIEELKKIVETMSFNGDVQNFLESIGPFYEFINLNSPELDAVKETIDRLTSSSDSSCTSSVSGSLSQTNSLPSSPDTTAQSTPAKEVKSEKVEITSVETIVANHDHNYAATNGHIPNENTQQRSIQSGQVNPAPPAAPVHKPLANGHALQYSLDLEKEDEIIEVPVQAARINSRSNSHSSESEKYYSGDSDTELDQTLVNTKMPSTSARVLAVRSEPLQSGSKSTSEVQQIGKQNHRSVKIRSATSEVLNNKFDSVMALQGTVDRLNRDIEHVLARLRILEAAYAANPAGVQDSSRPGGVRESRNKSRGLFKELSTTTWVVIFTWPVAVHLLFKLLSWWLDRRRRARSNPLAILS